MQSCLQVWTGNGTVKNGFLAPLMENLSGSFLVPGHPEVLQATLQNSGPSSTRKPHGQTGRLHPPSVPTSHGHVLHSKVRAVTPERVVRSRSLCSGPPARHPHIPPTSRGVGSRGLRRRACPGLGVATGRPRPPLAGRGGRAGARG